MDLETFLTKCQKIYKLLKEEVESMEENTNIHFLF